jgi:hypothetical protein
MHRTWVSFADKTSLVRALPAKEIGTRLTSPDSHPESPFDPVESASRPVSRLPFPVNCNSAIFDQASLNIRPKY